jgi:hypothetical protein
MGASQPGGERLPVVSRHRCGFRAESARACAFRPAVRACCAWTGASPGAAAPVTAGVARASGSPAGGSGWSGCARGGGTSWWHPDAAEAHQAPGRAFERAHPTVKEREPAADYRK